MQASNLYWVQLSHLPIHPADMGYERLDYTMPCPFRRFFGIGVRHPASVFACNPPIGPPGAGSGNCFQTAMWLWVAQAAGLPFLFCADHTRQLHRDSGGRQHLRNRLDQFPAQHWQQRGNVHGHQGTRAAGAIPPIGAVIPPPITISCFRTR